jgi:hypothetical protein
VGFPEASERMKEIEGFLADPESLPPAGPLD